jgi:hypothetical protein
MFHKRSTGQTNANGFAQFGCLATSGYSLKISKGNKMEFIDYSSILMDMEKLSKRLHEKCLHKQYEGYMADIAEMQAKTTLLGVWITEQKTKQYWSAK